jgi:hypothetical protein
MWERLCEALALPKAAVGAQAVFPFPHAVRRVM